jgi:hypothetical protein
MFLGTAFAFAMATTWAFGKTTWEQTDSTDPRKLLAQEVFTTVKASLPRFARNGSGNHSDEVDSANWIPHRRGEDEAPK